jgi:uncharacterized protein (TIGR02246 family)
MNDLERLAAIEEIRALIARYAIYFDDKDWAAFSQLWTADAAFVANGEAFEGREALLQFLTTCLPEGYSGKHMNSPPLIEIAPDGDSATAQTDVVWIAQNFDNQIVARYHDTLARSDGRWLFRLREEVVVPFTPGPPPMSEAAYAVSSTTMRAEEA